MRSRENLGLRTCWVALACGAMLTVAVPGQCGFEHLTQLEAQARILAEDRSGVIWFGGSGLAQGENLSSFDGIHFASRQLIGSGPGFQITEITPDRTGKVWVGSDGAGVFSYDGTRIEQFDALGGEFVWSCNAILEDADGHLWFALALGGVTRFDGTAWTVFRPVEGIGDHIVLDIEQDSKGVLWFGTLDNGLSRFDGTTWRQFTAPTLPDNAIVDVAEDGAGNVWAATPANGVARFDGVEWRTFTSSDGLASDSVTAIAIDPEGRPWFGTTRGLSRFDGSHWVSLRVADGLRDEHITDLLADQSGNLWIAGASGGLSRFDRTLFETVSPTGIPSGTALEFVLRDRADRLWFLRNDGVSRFDGLTWTHFTQGVELPGTPIDIAEGPAGDYWLLGYNWLSRFDGITFSYVPVPDSLGQVNAVAVDHDNTVWVATEFRGAVKYDGTNWTIPFDGGGVTSIFVATNGWIWFGIKGGSVASWDGEQLLTYRPPISNPVLPFARMGRFFEAGNGDVWVPLEFSESLFRFDGAQWESFSSLDHGLPAVHFVSAGPNARIWAAGTGRVQHYDGQSWSELLDNNDASVPVRSMVQDGAGNMWLDVETTLLVHEPDRVAPQTIVTERPPALSANRVETIAYAGVFDGSERIEYSFSFNDAGWSAWSTGASWLNPLLPDGINTFRVRARDDAGNVDASPAAVVFEIDATPPTPIIASPSFASAVRGRVEVLGTADDSRFTFYELEVKPSAAPWDLPNVQILARDSTTVVGSVLGVWDTANLFDGGYDLRLTVHDSLNLFGRAVVSVIVDNVAPPAEQTSPAGINARSGGDVYTTNSEVHLYFPPLAFAQDVLVSVDVLEGAPDSLEDGAPRRSPAYVIGWSQATLRKPATLEFSLGALGDEVSVQSLSIYSFTGTAWKRVGGSVLAPSGVIAASIDHPGQYALFGSSGQKSGPATLSGVTLTPRVFSPSGTFAAQQAAICFELGQPGSTTVRVYSRSGRLIREVGSNLPLKAGSNVVYWDGRDTDGNIVLDGIYVVSVEAVGQQQIQTLAVVR